MREVDRWAISEKKVAVEDLMERAGEGLAGVVARRAPAGRIVIVCGKGNNGGDGIVAARLLRQAGRDVEVLVVWPPEWMGEDAQAQLKKLPGPQPVAVRGRAAQQGARDRRLPARDRQLRLAALARRPGDRGDGGGEGARDRGRRPVRASTRRRARSRGRRCTASRRRRSTGRRSGCGCGRARSTRARSRSIDIGIPRGGPARPEAGLIGSRRAARGAAALARRRRSSAPATSSSSAARAG